MTHELGVDVMSELVKLWDYERKGEALEPLGVARISAIFCKTEFTVFSSFSRIFPRSAAVT